MCIVLRPLDGLPVSGLICASYSSHSRSESLHVIHLGAEPLDMTLPVCGLNVWPAKWDGVGAHGATMSGRPLSEQRCVGGVALEWSVWPPTKSGCLERVLLREKKRQTGEYHRNLRKQCSCTWHKYLSNYTVPVQCPYSARTVPVQCPL